MRSTCLNNTGTGISQRRDTAYQTSRYKLNFPGLAHQFIESMTNQELPKTTTWCIPSHEVMHARKVMRSSSAADSASFTIWHSLPYHKADMCIAVPVLSYTTKPPVPYLLAAPPSKNATMVSACARLTGIVETSALHTTSKSPSCSHYGGLRSTDVGQ